MSTLFLAIESSCDETAAAVFDLDRNVLASVVASQHELHARFGGVVPEIASRAHVRNILPVIDEALRQAGIALRDLACIAVNHTPGLVGALLVGVTAAKSLALALDIPVIAVNHIAAHIYACRMAAGIDIYPCVGFVVSGGHSALFDCATPTDMTLLGNTRDDAAGEAFDKVAAILGLGFPGGPAVEREARLGNAKAYQFPRSFLQEPRLEFSFSGLKTSVMYAAYGQNTTVRRGTLEPARRADLAASFQAAVVDVLVAKCELALARTGHTTLAVGGGVSANALLRSRLRAMCDTRAAALHIPPLSLCTDNAAMAALAVEKWHRNEFAPPELDAEPNFL